MKRLRATVAGVEVDSCLIYTGSHKSARRVPAAFARRAIAAGADLDLDTARGPTQRQIVRVGGRYYTRVGYMNPQRPTDLITKTRGPAGAVYSCKLCGHHETGRDARSKIDAYAAIRQHVAYTHRDAYKVGHPRAPAPTTKHNPTE